MCTGTEQQGAQRGNLPEGGETIEIWGSKYVWESVLEDAQALLRHQLLNDSSKLDSHRLSSIRRTTLQVDVDIDCTETFFVSDDTTQEVRCPCARRYSWTAVVGRPFRRMYVDPVLHFFGEPQRGWVSYKGASTQGSFNYCLPLLESASVAGLGVTTERATT